MRMRLHRSVLLALCAIAFVPFLGCRNINQPGLLGIPRSVSAASVVDTWIGLTELDTAYYKLSLYDSGSGALYVLNSTGAIAEYRITDWSIQDSYVRCEFKRDRSPGNPSRLDCEVRESQLRGKLTGVGGWTESILFRRAKPFDRSLSRLRNAGRNDGGSNQ